MTDPNRRVELGLTPGQAALTAADAAFAIVQQLNTRAADPRGVNSLEIEAHVALANAWSNVATAYAAYERTR